LCAPVTSAGDSHRLKALDQMSQPASIEFCGQAVPYRQGDKTFERTCGSTVSALVQCERCGYCAFDPKPTASELNEHYQTAYPQASSPHYDFDLEYNRLDLPAVAAHLIETARRFGCRAESLEAHDYGCAMGNLVHALRQAGVNATGHDINQDWIAQASTRLGDAVSSLPFEEIFKDSARQLHLVTMLHTLEHMPRPLEALRTIRNHLGISGIVYICVPSALFLVAEVLGREADENFIYPTHLHYFTPTSMTCLLSAAGMRPLHVETRATHLSPRGRDSLLLAARQIGLRDDEPMLMDKLAKQFRTAELFTIATRGDNPIAADSCLPGRLAEVADFERRRSTSGDTWTARIGRVIRRIRR
jgi:2-polyprenyl-3-methyl-5-hydroxy-6-metoxy-1,4-benzoquinol methylase